MIIYLVLIHPVELLFSFCGLHSEFHHVSKEVQKSHGNWKKLNHLLSKHYKYLINEVVQVTQCTFFVYLVHMT